MMIFFFCSFLFPPSSYSHGSFFLPSHLLLRLSLMCFLCEWKTERPHASAGHQTFTSRGSLECRKTERYRKGERQKLKSNKEKWGSHTKKDADREIQSKTHAETQRECKRQRQTEKETWEQLSGFHRRVIVSVPVGQEFTSHQSTARPDNATIKHGIHNWAHQNLENLLHVLDSRLEQISLKTL